MKKNIICLFATTLLLAAVACSKDEAAGDGVQYVSELKVKFEGETRVAAAHSEAGLKFAWEGGDQIKLYESNNAESIEYIYVYDSSTGTFKPKEGSPMMMVGTSYFAAYQVRQTTTPLSVDGSQTIVKMNLAIEGDAKGLAGIPLISDVFAATAEGTIATMHHLCGVVEVPVKLNSAATLTTVNQFSISDDGSRLAGDFTATPSTPYLHSVEEGSDTAYSEKEDVVLDKESTTSIFIPLLPGTYIDPVINYSYIDAKEKTYDGHSYLHGTLTVKRGKIVKLPEVIAYPI